MKLIQRIKLGAVLATLGLSVPAQAIVYTASNEIAENRVIAFGKSAFGNLTKIGAFGTGGTGTGAPIGNQAALALDAGDRWLFVTNAGDGTVTSFRLLPAGLQFVNNVASGGHSAISVTVFGTLVYVLNEGSGDVGDSPEMQYDTISGFRFSNIGELVPIAGSTRILDNTQLTAPAQVGFNKSGTVLFITEKATSMLTTYVMQADDTPANVPLKRPSAVPTPFGFQFGDRDYVFVTEANGGARGATVSYRVDRETGAVSGLVGRVDQDNATCWTVLSSDQTMGYSTNTASGTVTPYTINFDGTMTPLTRRGIRTGAGPRDAILTQDNQFLFTLNNGDGVIRTFRVFRDGRIWRRRTVPVPGSSTGLLSR